MQRLSETCLPTEVVHHVHEAVLGGVVGQVSTADATRDGGGVLREGGGARGLGGVSCGGWQHAGPDVSCCCNVTAVSLEVLWGCSQAIDRPLDPDGIESHHLCPAAANDSLLKTLCTN